MTYERREEIFSKEVITLQDFCELYSLSKGAASVKMREIKRKVGDRLGIQGRLHIEDYLAWVNMSSATPERYQRPIVDDTPHIKTSSVCYAGRRDY